MTEIEFIRREAYITQQVCEELLSIIAHALPHLGPRLDALNASARAADEKLRAEYAAANPGKPLPGTTGDPC